MIRPFKFSKSTSIKAKIGICPDCPAAAGHKPLIAGRCNLHYWKHRQEVNKKKTAHTVIKERKLTLGKWYNLQIQQLPKYCENCGDYLNPFAPWTSRAYIAHIVPKRNLHSVETHAMNRWFGCIDCHANYDNWLERDIITKMPKVVKIARERFQLFKDEIHPSEDHFVQDFLR